LLNNEIRKTKPKDTFPRTKLLALILFPLGMGLGVLVWGINRVMHGDADGGFMVLVGMGFCLLALCFYLLYGYKCTISELGVTVKYPLGKGRLHTWGEFQQVCICYDMDYKQSPLDARFSVICCIKHGVEKNSYGRWRINNPLYLGSIITMDYTKKLHKEMKEHCPQKVVDLR